MKKYFLIIFTLFFLSCELINFNNDPNSSTHRNINTGDPDIDDFWNGDAKWDFENAIADNIGGDFGFHFAHMLVLPNSNTGEDEIWAYYIKNDVRQIDDKVFVDSHNVGLAISSDGVNWVDKGIVLYAGGVWDHIFHASDGNIQHTVNGDVIGKSYRVRKGNSDAGWLCYGPYTTEVRGGPNDAGFHLMLEDSYDLGSNDLVCTIEVFNYTTNESLGFRDLKVKDFFVNQYNVFHINFDAPSNDPNNEQLDFRTYWYGTTDLKQLSVAVAQGTYVEKDDINNPYTHLDSFNSSFAHVWVEGESNDRLFYMVYEGSDGDQYRDEQGEAHKVTSHNPGDIRLAISSNGTDFYRHSQNVILSPDPSLPHERQNIGTPTLYRYDGQWYLFYHSYDLNSHDCQMCVAYGPDILNLQKSTCNPVMPTISGTWEEGTIGFRSSIIIGPKTGLCYIAYEGSTDYREYTDILTEDNKPGEGFEESLWGIGIARAQITDFTYWDRSEQNPVVTRTHSETPTEEKYIRLGKYYTFDDLGLGNDGPELLVFKGTTYMCYRSRSEYGTRLVKLVWNEE